MTQMVRIKCHTKGSETAFTEASLRDNGDTST